MLARTLLVLVAAAAIAPSFAAPVVRRGKSDGPLDDEIIRVDDIEGSFRPVHFATGSGSGSGSGSFSADNAGPLGKKGKKHGKKHKSKKHKFSDSSAANLFSAVPTAATTGSIVGVAAVVGLVATASIVAIRRRRAAEAANGEKAYLLGTVVTEGDPIE
eukprot:m.434846 g.434846  ORF g.434846 m.434846 type:complete len:159 (-) comp17777_c0_seq1:115-591(-)